MTAARWPGVNSLEFDGIKNALRWLWAMADAAYCEAYWDYCRHWDGFWTALLEDVE